MDRFILKAPYEPTGDPAAGDRAVGKRFQGRQSMPDFTGGYGFWKNVYDGKCHRAASETDACDRA